MPPRWQIAPMVDTMRQSRSGLFELGRDIAEVLPGYGQLEVETGLFQAVQQLKETLRALIVLPTLVPEDQRRANDFPPGHVGLQTDADWQDMRAVLDLSDQFQPVVIRKVFEQVG